jgi:hypothetical protein
MKWFQLWQNNSGGSYNFAHPRIYLIQATNLKQAKKIAKTIVNFEEGCKCCGPRWGKMDEDSEIADLDLFTDGIGEDLTDWLEINMKKKKNVPYISLVHFKEGD